MKNFIIFFHRLIIVTRVLRDVRIIFAVLLVGLFENRQNQLLGFNVIRKILEDHALAVVGLHWNFFSEVHLLKKHGLDR